MYLQRFSFSFLVCFLIVYLLPLSIIDAQSNKSRLQSKQEKLKQEMQIMNKQLRANQKSSKNTLYQARNLNRKIEIRNELIVSMRKEAEMIGESIDVIKSNIEDMKVSIVEMKNEYAEMIVNSYKKRPQQLTIMFILSAENFYQAFQRLKFIQRYTEERKNQVNRVFEQEKDLEGKVKSLRQQQRERVSLLSTMRKEKVTLQSEKKQQEKLLKNLKRKRSQIVAQLNRKKKEERRISREIERLIKLEMKSNSSRSYNLALDKDFRKNRDRLPWPVKKGVVVRKFGKQPYPGMKGIYTENSGVYIATDPNAKATSIFGGEVVKVYKIPNGNMAVLLKHGQYYTFYGNLKDVEVKEKDKVKSGQTLGIVYTERIEGRTELDFQLWHKNKKQNPAHWIYRM